MHGRRKLGSLTVHNVYGVMMVPLFIALLAIDILWYRSVPWRRVEREPESGDPLTPR